MSVDCASLIVCQLKLDSYTAILLVILALPDQNNMFDEAPLRAEYLDDRFGEIDPPLKYVPSDVAAARSRVPNEQAETRSQTSI